MTLEFISFLLPIQLEMVGVINQANFRVEQDTGLCEASKVVFAWTTSNRGMGVCLDNIEQHAKYDRNEIKRIVNQAVTHESVHVAQMCNKGNTVLSQRVQLNDLTPTQKKSVVRSMAYSLNLGSAALEAEAYYMEKSPTLTAYMLKRYCL
jgi:hypothetical protein